MPSFGYWIFLVTLFLTLWLAPVAVSLFVALTGYHFSFVGRDFHFQNLTSIGLGLFVVFVSGIVGAALVRFTFYHTDRLGADTRNAPLNRIQLSVLIFLFALSAYGLIYSFGGSFLSRSYSGAVNSFLGYGAWSVTFLFVFSVLLFEYLRGRSISVYVIAFVTSVFLPVLLSGSRIDFLSFMIALSVYITSRKDIDKRYIWAAIVFSWAIFVILPIGQLRAVGDALGIIDLLSEDGALGQVYVPIRIDELGNMFHLSTIGDIGASVFQVVGLVENGASHVGFGAAAVAYANRLLPGPFFPNRAGDFASELSEPIGGGALHAMGEAFLIGGYYGYVFVGLFMGALISASILVAVIFKCAHPAVRSLIFVFPWLLLIRGGWYQFFSTLKSIEICFFLIILLHFFATRKKNSSE